MMRAAGSVLVVAIAAGAMWLAWPAEQEQAATATPKVASAAAQASPASSPEAFAWPAEVTGAMPVPAAQSMAEMRLHGDPQSPPIDRTAAPVNKPTMAELNDPKAYQAYESRQNARLYAAYVAAVDIELPRLRDDIKRGRAFGIDANEIAKAEEKARRMEELRDQLLKEKK